MAEPVPPSATRDRITTAILWSLLFPGAGHAREGRPMQGLVWFLGCQVALFLGLALAGATQLDYGFSLGTGGTRYLFLLLPEMGNFAGFQVAAQLHESVEAGGKWPRELPWRHVGHLLSGASGVLGLFAAAHAAGVVIARRHPAGGGLHPGTAAAATLLLPGLGHWLSGRRFKAVLLAVSVGSLFLIGMALGDFADFDRQRHPYYWIGQMFLGLPGWVVAWMAIPAEFERVLPYQDAGLLFTTSAGFFNVVVALDAFHRVEVDWLRRAGVDAEDAGNARGDAREEPSP